MGALKTLVREMKGMNDTGEILFGNMFNAVRWKVQKGLGNVLPKGKMDELESSIGFLQKEGQGSDVSRRLTSFFYASTLGLNTASSAKNLMQPALTTMPSIGIGPTMAGYGVLRDRLPGYSSAFIRHMNVLKANPSIRPVQRINLAQERAFHEAFPELAASGIKADPRAFELSEAQLLKDVGRLGGRVRRSDDYFKLLLQPFTQTELSNQVVTFYGGKKKLLNDLRSGALEPPASIRTGARLTGAELDEYLNLEASNLVNLTQFRPGAGSRSVLQTMIPPPFRMFTSFPLRLANFFVDSTVRGALTQAQMRQASWWERATGGRNLGTMARTYVMGRTVNEGLRNVLGVDMSDALGISGPFTGIVESGRILSPLTFSPLPKAVLGMASFASTRDLRDLNPLELPGVGKLPLPKTLVPAGVQISRMSKAFRAFRPDLGGFVDEDERLMFQGDTSDAVLGMLGIPLEKERRMREAMDRMHENRFLDRKLKRRFATAVRNFDTAEMDKVRREHQDAFPGLPPLNLSQKDRLRTMESARMTAVQRMLRTMGRNLGYVAERDLYEFDPDLVAEQPVFERALP
jgi:hypothetical protein